MGLTLSQRRLVSFGGSAVAVEYDHPRIAQVVEFLFGGVPASSDVPPHATFVLTGEPPGTVAIHHDGALAHASDSEADWAEWLLGNVCHHLARQIRGGLLFHAAALAWQGRGLLLPGEMGAGKTTLAAWLMAQGLDYLTDELVWIPHQSNALQAFGRPLSIKSGAIPVLQDYFELEPSARVLRGPAACLMLPPPAPGKREAKLSLMIFARYQPGGAFALQPLSKAQAGLALMQSLINARHLPEHGFAEVTRLAKTVPAYRLSYAQFDQIGNRLSDLIVSNGRL